MGRSLSPIHPPIYELQFFIPSEEYVLFTHNSTIQGSIVLKGGWKECKKDERGSREKVRVQRRYDRMHVNFQMHVY